MEMFDFALKPLPAWYSKMLERTILVVIAKDRSGEPSTHCHGADSMFITHTSNELSPRRACLHGRMICFPKAANKTAIFKLNVFVLYKWFIPNNHQFISCVVKATGRKLFLYNLPFLKQEALGLYLLGTL